ncbi:uncharacterized protein LOC144091126 [Stigmatopora argus]
MRLRGWLALLAAQVLMLVPGDAFELQDTIHQLVEENIHLHDRLENLTRALGKLRRMLHHHANDPTQVEHHEQHNEDVQHLWEEWSERGVSAETHLLLEHTFCGHDPHGSAGPPHGGPASDLLILMVTTACLSLLLNYYY